MANQGIITFAGLSGILEGSYTISHGVSPGVVTIYIAPRPGLRLPNLGTVNIQYGGARLTFPDCKLDFISDDIDPSGKEVWGLHILDHRWRWRFGRISGRYNVRVPKLENNGIREGTIKRPREIAKLCFEALGEDRVDVSAMPNDTLPFLEFDYERPDQALGKILDATGCRVVFNANNQVRVVRAGVGAALPRGNRLNVSATFDPPEAPEKIIFAGSKQLWNADIPLEAVGRDLDGSVKLIDELSYAPADGWDAAAPPSFNNIKDIKALALAQETVFRWYRIKAPFDLHGEREKVKSIEDVLPIETEQARTAVFIDKKERLPAWVFGKYDVDAEAPSDSIELAVAAIAGDLKKFPESLYMQGFSLDAEHGIVKFSQAVYRMVGPDRKYNPADLRLRTAVGRRDKEGGWVHYEIERKIPGVRTRTEPEYLTREDIPFMTWKVDGGAVETNEKEYKDQAKHYIDAKLREYDFNDPQTATYVGFINIPLDGAIQQVTWTLDSSGKATTRASRNREEVLTSPTYEQRRWLERVNAAIAARAKGPKP